MGSHILGRRGWRIALLAVTPLAAPSQAVADGQAAADVPSIETTRCASNAAWSCAPRQRLVLRGHGLSNVTSIAFTGRRGGRDDRFASAQNASTRRLVVTVPSGARSGLLRIRSEKGVVRTENALRLRKKSSPSRAKNLAAVQPVAGAESPSEVFPINGKHDMGQSPTNNFGGARSHGGQDMFASCGTPLVATVSGSVQANGYHAAAGNYVVIKDVEGRSHVYMHMVAASVVKQGDRVIAGQRVGAVGDSGRATGCHLHFELWTAPGWYSGGSAIDPLPQLRQWESQPHGHS